ncbi:hypothetical protein FQN54_005466 [Arachnomyces sp. PD_36]|nr:hypothetical protein FQN54_005466 [Arachnomyces sp. PD_36]
MIKTVAISALFAVVVALLSSHPVVLKAWQDYASPGTYACDYDGYRMEIVSVDPLVMYINDFLSEGEVDGLLQAGEGKYNESRIFASGLKRKDSQRESLTAPIPTDNQIAQCVQSRVRNIMGSTLSPTKDEISIPQLTKYEAGGKYDLHQDWYRGPQKLKDGRKFNRLSSFYTFMEDGCTEGEMHLPGVKAVNYEGAEGRYREHEGGGVAFKPVRGNAVFWMNMKGADGATGDDRVKNADLPVGEGEKIVMSVWAKKFY